MKFNVPEIKNKTPLEIAAEFDKKHCKPKREDVTEKYANRIISYETKLWLDLLKKMKICC